MLLYSGSFKGKFININKEVYENLQKMEISKENSLKLLE